MVAAARAESVPIHRWAVAALALVLCTALVAHGVAAVQERAPMPLHAAGADAAVDASSAVSDADATESGYAATVFAILRSSLGGEAQVYTEADLAALNAADAEAYAEGEVVAAVDARTGALHSAENPPTRQGFKYKLHFAKFADDYRKVYKGDEMDKRFATWKLCVDRIAWLNSKELSAAEYRLSSNRLCDKEHVERQLMLGFRTRRAAAALPSVPSGVPDPKDPKQARAAAIRASAPVGAQRDSRSLPKSLDPESINSRTLPFAALLQTDAQTDAQTLSRADIEAMAQADAQAAAAVEFSLEHQSEIAAHVQRVRAGMSADMRAAVDAQVATGSLDWRTLGAVSPVRFQGGCGNCWAWTAAAVAEGAWKIAGHPLTVLSAQQLTDCSRESPNSGCSGGDPSTALTYASSHGGLCSEQSYPTFKGPQGACRKCTPVAQVSKSQWDDKGVEDALEQYLRAGPVGVAVYGSSFSFQHYKSGVFNGADCNAGTVNHAVTAVGYGTDPAQGAYWLIKNTWDTSWGENGYVRIKRGVNRCKLATEFAVVNSKGVAPTANTGPTTAPEATDRTRERAARDAGSSGGEWGGTPNTAGAGSAPVTPSPGGGNPTPSPSSPAGGNPGGSSPAGGSPSGSAGKNKAKGKRKPAGGSAGSGALPAAGSAGAPTEAKAKDNKAKTPGTAGSGAAGAPGTPGTPGTAGAPGSPGAGAPDAAGAVAAGAADAAGKGKDGKAKAPLQCTGEGVHKVCTLPPTRAVPQPEKMKCTGEGKNKKCKPVTAPGPAGAGASGAASTPGSAGSTPSTAGSVAGAAGAANAADAKANGKPDTGAANGKGKNAAAGDDTGKSKGQGKGTDKEKGKGKRNPKAKSSLAAAQQQQPDAKADATAKPNAQKRKRTPKGAAQKRAAKPKSKRNRKTPFGAAKRANGKPKPKPKPKRSGKGAAKRPRKPQSQRPKRRLSAAAKKPKPQRRPRKPHPKRRATQRRPTPRRRPKPKRKAKAKAKSKSARRPHPKLRSKPRRSSGGR